MGGPSPLAGTYAGKAQVLGFFGKMVDLYEGSLQLQTRAVLADDGDGVVLTAERARFAGAELAYTSAHVFRFAADGTCGQFTALTDDAYHAFWAQHAAHPSRPSADATVGHTPSSEAPST